MKNYQPYIIFCEVCFRSSPLRDNENYNEVSLFRSCFGIFYYLLERKYRPLLITDDLVIWWFVILKLHFTGVPSLTVINARKKNVYLFHHTSPTISHK